jgi:O-antigen chain-terminating methyltransferase
MSMSRHFDYTAFEEHFRGDSQTIRQKLSVYLPLVRQLKLDASRPALDIACGRGEWIQLLTENRIPVAGMDINADSAEICRQKGFDVEESDLFEYLERRPLERYGLVTGFHIIEHLSLEQQQELFRVVHDRLAPGGMMILETPNPENTTVGACNFYIDPTHTRPVPPPLLEYFASEAGFASSRILRVNRSSIGVSLPALPDDIPGAGHYNQLAGLLLSRVFQAPDYALVAFREPSPDQSMMLAMEEIVKENGGDEPDEQSRETFIEELRERERQISRLNEMLQEERQQSAGLAGQLEERCQTSANLVDQLEEQRRQSANLVDQLEEQRRQSANLVDQLEEQRRQSAGLVDQLEEQRRQSDLLFDQFEEQRLLSGVLERTLSEQQHQFGAMIDELKQQSGDLSGRLEQREAELSSLYNTELGKLLKKYKVWKKSIRQQRRQQSSTLADTPPSLDGSPAVSSQKVLTYSAKQIFKQLSDAGAQCPADR